MSSGQANAEIGENRAPTLNCLHEAPILAVRTAQTGANTTQAVATGMQVRRLTPRECERLQGFPDDYTAITVKGKPAADGPRYKALGNSMAVNVMRWIGERIQAAHDAAPLTPNETVEDRS